MAAIFERICSVTLASWNQVTEWLRQLDCLRRCDLTA